MSYFSRQQAAHEFITQAWVETHRRGVESSRLVCAVTDGAEWIQTFISAHRPNAIRVLDFYHASEHLAEVGRALFGAETPAFYAWQQTQCHTLKHADPDTVLAELRQRLADTQADTARIVEETLHYFEQRRAMLDYAHFQGAHLPIGSGSGEAAHKVVIECRMKQAGMRWAEPNINRLATLRNLVCNDRWDEGWAAIVQVTHPSQHHATRPSQPASPMAPSSSPRHLPPDFTLKPAVPWRNRPIGKAAYEPSSARPGA